MKLIVLICILFQIPSGNLPSYSELIVHLAFCAFTVHFAFAHHLRAVCANCFPFDSRSTNSVQCSGTTLSVFVLFCSAFVQGLYKSKYIILHSFVTECDDGTYGFDCVNNCSSHCLNNSSCEKHNGHCKNGCNPGYTNLLCNERK